MSAQISATGTWTDLGVDTTLVALGKRNVPTLGPTNFDALATRPWPELKRIIEIVAVGYGITYQAASVLLTEGLHAERHRSPLEYVQQVYTP